MNNFLLYDAAIYCKAISMGIPAAVAKNIVAQARFETNDYTNNACVYNNNLFGYKTYKGSSWQLGSGNKSSEGDTYAMYATVLDSTGEIVSWLRRRQNEHRFTIANLISAESYANALKACSYYGGKASDYTNGIHSKMQLINWDLLTRINDQIVSIAA